MKVQEKIGTIEAIVEGVRAIAPGLTLDNIAKDVGHELKANVAHGAHELAAALFNGQGFVMYPRGKHDDGKEKTQEQVPQVDLPQRQQERGGRGL